MAAIPKKSTPAASLHALDRKFLFRDDDPDDLQVARSKGAFLIDTRGRRYIDFTSGWNVGNFGWDNDAIRDAIREFRGPAYVAPNFLYRPWAELASLLAELTPGNLRKCFRATGGTEAVDIALQIAMAYTQRRRFVALEGSYHGNSVATVSIAATESREPVTNRLAGCATIDPPLDDAAAEKIETLLKHRDVAAVILEPVALSIGVLIPEEGFMRRLRRLCTRYGTLLIFDEVACGFGRTGALFATEHSGVTPDILTMGKAITGGYVPMGAVITTAKIANAIEGEVGFYSTFGWHPLSVAAALANLRELRKHGAKLMKHVGELSSYFAGRLAAMKIGPLHVKGLAIAIETEDADEIGERCRERGLLVSPEDEHLLLFPPLTIDRRTAAKGLDILKGAASATIVPSSRERA